MTLRIREKRHSMSHIKRENLRLAIIMLAPIFVILMAVSVYPLIRSFDISLRLYNLTKPGLGTPYIGLENYRFVLTDARFWQSVKVTAVFVVISVTFVIVLSTAIALLLNCEFRGRGIVRALMLVPWAIPNVANGLMWLWILNPSYGALNGLLSQLGLIDHYIVWLGDKRLALIMVILAEAWKETPFIMLMILAALQSIPKEMYEAAQVDGSRYFQTLFKITLPMIRPTLFVAITLRTIWAIKSFDLIYTLTSGGPDNATSTIGYYTYLRSFISMNLGRGSAAAWLMTLVMIGLTVLYQRALYMEE